MVLAIPAAAAAGPALGAGGAAGLAPFLGPAAAALPFLSGGGSTNVNVSQSTSTSVVSSPAIGIVIGDGTASPDTQGTADARARSEALQPEFFARAPGPLLPLGTNDLSALPGLFGSNSQVSAAGLLNNPVILIALAGLVLVFVVKGRRR